MKKNAVIDALSALAQDTRLDIFRLLVEAGSEGMPAGGIAAALGLPLPTLSFHLNQLRQSGLIDYARDGRSLIYRAEYETMTGLLAYLTENCCKGDMQACGLGSDSAAARVYNVLFLCTGNSARSIMAESLLREEGRGRFRAFSAGSRPSGTVHPRALSLLEGMGLPTEGLRSKSWDEFAKRGAPVMDFVFTVCDNAAGEVCPVWPGQPITAHWGIEDPTAVTGSEGDQQAAFVQALRYLRNRISLFVALPIASLDTMALGKRLTQIGRVEGAAKRAQVPPEPAA